MTTPFLKKIQLFNADTKPHLNYDLFMAIGKQIYLNVNIVDLPPKVVKKHYIYLHA